MTPDESIGDDLPFRVLATIVAFEPGFRAGGPVISVARIIDSAPTEIEVALITRDRDIGASEPYEGLSGRWIARGSSQVFYLATRRPAQWLRLVRDLRARKYDVLYLNSLWEPMFTIIPVLGVCLRLIHVKSILLAPRGELSPGALSLKTRKKRLFLKVWRPLLQQLNIEWHASTDQEAQDISSTFPGGRVIVNCDQVSPPFEPMPAGSPHEGPIRMVFISRISPKKNLLLVLKALCLLSSPAEFDIFGPTEDREYWANCQSVIGQMPLNVRVLYRGELVHQEVRQTFSRYDAFVLPTLGENFGHVIAESLSASCPVICSEATPWTDLLDAGGGTIVRDLSPEGLAVTLEDLVHLSPSERVAAKQSAGNAFLAWRSSCVDANVLDQFRHGPQRG